MFRERKKDIDPLKIEIGLTDSAQQDEAEKLLDEVVQEITPREDFTADVTENRTKYEATLAGGEHVVFMVSLWPDGNKYGYLFLGKDLEEKPDSRRESTTLTWLIRPDKRCISQRISLQGHLEITDPNGSIEPIRTFEQFKLQRDSILNRFPPTPRINK